MDAVALTEAPSESRRRLSKGFIKVEQLEDVRRRNSGAFLAVPPLQEASESTKDDLDDDDSSAAPRASVVGRRASTWTRLYAMMSTCDSFLERPGLRPVIVTGMLFFKDPEPSIEAIRKVFSSRLLEMPRFRSTFRYDKDSNQVHWEPLPRDEVDFEHHIQLREGKGTFDLEKDLENLLDEVYLTNWDTSKPLWKGTLITNLKDGRSMLLCAIDHAIGDGVALLQVMLSLMDDKPESFQKPRRKIPSTASNKKRWPHRAVDFVTGVKDGVVQALAPPADPENSLKLPKEFLGSGTAPTGKTFVQTRAFDLNEIMAMKSKLEGTTVNDIVMGMHAIALQRYYGDTKEPILQKSKIVRGDFLVNCRPAGKPSLSNNFIMGVFPFPLEEKYNDKNLVDAVWKCKAEIDTMKVSPVFHVKKAVTDFLLPIIPVDALSKQIDEQGFGSSLMISNVMGPPEEASLAGYKLDDLNFTCLGVTNLYTGILSYNGKLRISLVLDKLAKGDARKFRDCLESAYDDLKPAILDGTIEQQPAMPKTPFSAKLLETVCYAGAVVVPVLVARGLMGGIP